MSFIQSKKSFLSSGLLVGMTDIHCHLLPGVDDGVRSYQEAVAVLRWMRSIGIKNLYLTPHVMSDFPKNTSAFLAEQFDRLVQQLEKEEVKDLPALRLGAEYMLEGDCILRKAEGHLTFAGNHLLIETSYLTPPMGFFRLLADLIERGFSLVLAHPERYAYMETGDYEVLKKINIKFQLNYLAMAGIYGSTVKEKALFLLKEGFYDFVGSDLHHLAFHQTSIAIEKFTPKQTALLRPLFHNNHHLW